MCTVKEDGFTWEYAYFLDEIISQSILVRGLSRIFSYGEKYSGQGFTVLDEEKSDAVLENFYFESSVYYPQVTESEYNDSLDCPLDKPVKGLRLTKQGFLENTSSDLVVFQNVASAVVNFPEGY